MPVISELTSAPPPLTTVRSGAGFEFQIPKWVMQEEHPTVISHYLYPIITATIDTCALFARIRKESSQ